MFHFDAVWTEDNHRKSCGSLARDSTPTGSEKSQFLSIESHRTGEPRSLSMKHTRYVQPRWKRSRTNSRSLAALGRRLHVLRLGLGVLVKA